MIKTIVKIFIIALVVGLSLGALFEVVPALDNMIPDKFKSIIIGCAAGVAAVTYPQKKKPKM